MQLNTIFPIVACNAATNVVATTVGEMGTFVNNATTGSKTVTDSLCVVAPAGTKLTVVCSTLNVKGTGSYLTVKSHYNTAILKLV